LQNAGVSVIWSMDCCITEQEDSILNTKQTERKRERERFVLGISLNCCELVGFDEVKLRSECDV